MSFSKVGWVHGVTTGVCKASVAAMLLSGCAAGLDTDSTSDGSISSTALGLANGGGNAGASSTGSTTSNGSNSSSSGSNSGGTSGTSTGTASTTGGNSGSANGGNGASGGANGSSNGSNGTSNSGTSGGTTGGASGNTTGAPPGGGSDAGTTGAPPGGGSDAGTTGETTGGTSGAATGATSGSDAGASSGTNGLGDGATGGDAGSANGVSETTPAAPLDLDIHRSLVVTEQPLLENFTFFRVMDQLATQANVADVNATSMFQQWWDTQNYGPGLGKGPHCDDEGDSEGYGPTLNRYPYTCRPAPAEGGEANCNPFEAGSPCEYIPIALFNRFDLAPLDGSHCGEHRIVFARASGRTNSRARNLIIFEAVLPNPHPVQGLMGCKKIADFWGDLTKENDLMVRKAKLEDFYFNGLANVPPVVHIDHFGNQEGGYGQIRTNQFIQPESLAVRAWSLREFKVYKTCSEGTCDVNVVPVTNKTNPFGPLFNAAWTDPNAADFQSHFLTQVPSLAGSTLSSFGMSIPNVYNSAQSQSSGSTETLYGFNFGTAPSAFRAQIDGALSSIGSTLSADDIIARAQTQSCAGCHRFSSNARLGGGLTWPSALGFVHVSERDQDRQVVDGVTRYGLSVALENNFLPHRKLVLENYIQNPPPNSQSKRSLGGSSTH